MATKSRNRPTRTSGVSPGARVQTNAAFSRLFASGVREPWPGKVARAHSTMTGSWYVRFDDHAHLMLIAEKFLEVQP